MAIFPRQQLIQSQLLRPAVVLPGPRACSVSALPSGVVEVDTAGAAAYDGDTIAEGLLFRDPASGNRTDTLPTAAETIASLELFEVGRAREFVLCVRGANTVTVAVKGGDTDTTLIGPGLIAANTNAVFLVRRSGADTVQWIRL
jgi:hypothetical protein